MRMMFIINKWAFSLVSSTWVRHVNRRTNKWWQSDRQFMYVVYNLRTDSMNVRNAAIYIWLAMNSSLFTDKTRNRRIRLYCVFPMWQCLVCRLQYDILSGNGGASIYSDSHWQRWMSSSYRTENNTSVSIYITHRLIAQNTLRMYGKITTSVLRGSDLKSSAQRNETEAKQFQ